MSNSALPSSLNSERVERLLAHLWERRGTDLLLTVGAPPLVRVDGELFAVPGEETLTPADTEQLIHSLLTDENLAVFRPRARVRLRLQLAGARPDARQRLPPAGFVGSGAADDPGRDPDAGRPRPSPRRAADGRVAVGAHPGDGPHRVGQVDDAGGHGRPRQQPAALPHPHHRGPHRVRPRARPRGRQPARGRRRHPLLRPGPALRPPGGPRRPHGRRDPRPGLGRHRPHHGRDRPPRLRHRAHQRHVPGRRPRHRRVPRRHPEPGPAAALGQPRRRDLPAAHPQDRRRPGGRLRDPGRHRARCGT